jgi:hypothetical protein
MNLGEIRVFRFKRAQSGAETIPANVGIDAPAKLFVVDEEMPVIIDVFGAHGSYREILLWGVIGLIVSPLSLAPPTPADPRDGPT